MKPPSSRWIFIAGAAAVAVLTAGWLAGRWLRERRLEDDRFDKQATLVTIADLAGARKIDFFVAGASLENSRELGVAGNIWLPPGNYFLRASLGDRDLLFPVPLTHYRGGPEKEGSIAITVRALPEQRPPSLIPEASFVYVPSGHFLIGDRANPREPHYVWLTSYFIGQFEVTNAEFQQFLHDPKGYDSPGHWSEAGLRWKSASHTEASAVLKPEADEYRRFGQPDQPVTSVGWYEAQAFCRWLTARIGARRWLFSLPTDAQWEKAARGPDSFEFGLGMSISDAESPLYNWKKNPSAPVTVVGVAASKARYKPNRYGLYHVSGNVAEWTQSSFRPFNRQKPYRDDDGRNREDLAEHRTVRGGSWYSASIAVLSNSYRDAFLPDHRNNDLGFRIVCQVLP